MTWTAIALIAALGVAAWIAVAIALAFGLGALVARNRTVIPAVMPAGATASRSRVRAHAA